MLTETQIRETATNLRKLASDPKLKTRFSSAERKSFNDNANLLLSTLDITTLHASEKSSPTL
jgi:hypothetical protein